MKIREAAPIRDVIVAKISPLVTIDDIIITRLDIDHKQISKIDNDLKLVDTTIREYYELNKIEGGKENE